MDAERFNERVRTLIDACCERRELSALAIMLDLVKTSADEESKLGERLTKSCRRRRASPVVSFEEHRRLLAEYRSLAATVSTRDFYRQVRSKGVTKAEAFFLLRDLYGLNLIECQQVADSAESK